MMAKDGPRIRQDAPRMSHGSPQDALRMVPGLLRMAEDGARIARDAPRMFQGLPQCAPGMAPGLLRLAQGLPRMHP